MLVENLPYYQKLNNINLLVLKGDKQQMGIDYGRMLQEELSQALNILINFYAQYEISYNKLLEKANLFYNRYPNHHKAFIEGISKGSGINIDNCKILLGMETLNALLRNNSELSACSFLYNQGIIGRNYDFPQPFNEIAKYLTLTILHEENKLPTAFISMPGQIYCPTCINSEKVFVEFNNGMPSGGFQVNIDQDTLLVNLLESVQRSKNLDVLDERIYELATDYSLIVNAAALNETRSYEFSTLYGMKPYYPLLGQPYSSTNFFQNNTWNQIPIAKDENTWLGVSRRDNLLSLLNTQNECEVECIKELMDKPIDQGGAIWEYTIYQIVYDSYTQNIYLKINYDNNDWIEIYLNEYFILEDNLDLSTF